MKVIEIVNEGPLDWIKTAGKILLPVQGKVDPNTVAPAYKTLDKAMKAGKKEFKHLKDIPVFGKIMYNWKMKGVEKAFQLARAEQSRVIVNNFGSTFWNIILFFNIGDALIDFYAAKKVLDQARPPDYDEQLNKLTGEFWTQILVPSVAMGIGKFGGAIFKILPALATMLGPGTMLPKAGINIRTAIDAIVKIGAAGVVAAVMAPGGKEVVTKALGDSIISGIGSLLPNPDTITSSIVNILDFIYTAVWRHGIKGERPSKQDPAAQGSSPSAPGQQPQGGAAPSGTSTTPGVSDYADAFKGASSIDDIAGALLKKQMGL